jgi:hypothetical protein
LERVAVEDARHETTEVTITVGYASGRIGHRATIGCASAVAVHIVAIVWCEPHEIGGRCGVQSIDESAICH